MMITKVTLPSILELPLSPSEMQYFNIVDDMVAKVKIQIESSPVPHREKKEESVVHVQHVNPQIKGFWTREEDELLKKAVESTNPIVWDIVAEQVPGRSPIQCRERWRNRLDPAVKKTRFERWEDNIIIREQKKIGNKWTLIANFLPGRTATAVKNRWYSVLKNVVSD